MQRFRGYGYGMEAITYNRVYCLIYAWVKDGKVWPQYKACTNNRSGVFGDYNILDEAILDVFGVPDSHQSFNRAYHFNSMLRESALKVDWLFGGNGLTLFKAFLLRQEK